MQHQNNQEVAPLAESIHYMVSTTDTPEAERLADELAQLASEGAALIHLQSGAYICQKFAEAAAPTPPHADQKGQ